MCSLLYIYSGARVFVLRCFIINSAGIQRGFSHFYLSLSLCAFWNFAKQLDFPGPRCENSACERKCVPHFQRLLCVSRFQMGFLSQRRIFNVNHAGWFVMCVNYSWVSHSSNSSVLLNDKFGLHANHWSNAHCFMWCETKYFSLVCKFWRTMRGKIFPVDNDESIQFS